MKIAVLFKICCFLMFDNNLDDNFDYVPDGISKKERHYLLTIFCKDFESAINFQISHFKILT